MKVLFIGDTVGSAGRTAVRNHLTQIQQEHAIDFTILNAENAAAGFGITPRIADELFSWGIDVLTSGNHIWDKREILSYLDSESRILRPANYPAAAPGHGSVVRTARNGFPVAVINVQGRVFMPATDDPFQAIDRELNQVKTETPVVIVDMHGEATSEKAAMGWYLDGRVAAVIGTHTHIPTADETVLPEGTAYITDVGMSGAFDSVIGMVKEGAIRRFLTALPVKFELATGDVRLNAVIVNIDERTGRARGIERIQRR